MEKPRFAGTVDLLLEIQVRIEPCPQISCHSDKSNVNDSYGKAINIHFGKLLLVPINMNSVLSSLGLSLSVSIHVQCRNVRYTAFHGNDRISLISSRVLHINKIETRRAFSVELEGTCAPKKLTLRNYCRA